MMDLFGRKGKKERLFGNSVEPNCVYCVHNSAPEGEPLLCAIRQNPGEKAACRQFDYDPLKRSPQNLPPLPKFDPEDFSL